MSTLWARKLRYGNDVLYYCMVSELYRPPVLTNSAILKMNFPSFWFVGFYTLKAGSFTLKTIDFY